jgi:hypothetical protein
MKWTYLWFDCQRTEVPGIHHQPPDQLDMRHRELHQTSSLGLPHSSEQTLHLCPGGIVGMQTRHTQPIEQNNTHYICIINLINIPCAKKSIDIMKMGIKREDRS